MPRSYFDSWWLNLAWLAVGLSLAYGVVAGLSGGGGDYGGAFLAMLVWVPAMLLLGLALPVARWWWLRRQQRADGTWERRADEE